MFNKRNDGAKKPTIRKSTVLVAKEPERAPSRPVPTARQPPAKRFQISQRTPANLKSAQAPAKRSKTETPEPARRAIAASRGRKRKSTTPDGPNFSSDDEDEDSSDIGASDSDASRKRVKSSVSSVDSVVGPPRPFVDEAAFDTTKDAEHLNIVHGADATSAEHETKFRAPWNQDYALAVELQYPTNSKRERFELKWPKNEKDDYQPMADITETIDTMCRYYFPSEMCEKYNNEEKGFGRRFKRAFKRESQEELRDIVNEFNEVMSTLVADGTSRREIASRRGLPLDFVNRITTQIYGRTVSPKVESLRAYKNGSDNVYGELLPRFCSAIFQQIKLNHEHVFIDLGSGVGNVVLQAALEVGCESWGVEMMKNPCDLAEVQANEFPGRTKLWGIACGSVNLVRGDFTNLPEITPVLQKADVVLVNNQAFTPALNAALIAMFLDLKDGAKIVSLKPFVPEDHRIGPRTLGNPVNLFTQERYEYFSQSVSWTDQSGYYYIAEKNPRPLEEYMRAHKMS